MELNTQRWLQLSCGLLDTLAQRIEVRGNLLRQMDGDLALAAELQMAGRQVGSITQGGCGLQDPRAGRCTEAGAGMQCPVHRSDGNADGFGNLLDPGGFRILWFGFRVCGVVLWCVVFVVGFWGFW